MDVVSLLMLVLLSGFFALILRWFKTDDRLGRPSETYTGPEHLYPIHS